MITTLEAPRGVGSRVNSAVAAIVAKPLFWVLAIAVLVTMPIVWAMHLKLPPPLPVLSTVPEFSFVDQNGKPFGTEQLRGKVWVASFVFTRCTGPCPDITKKMAAIQHRARNLEPAFRLVTFSVDPKHDTPERLAEYAKSFHASAFMWSFLTGPVDDVKRFVVKGMKLTMDDDQPDSELADITHDTHFVLVDGAGRIRGYYDSEKPEMEDDILRDAGLLLNRGN
ncbi:MAG: SCO family protein [Planctomycetes bacterium]|nr:SCO family protein [Planctomycetota bacterium]